MTLTASDKYKEARERAQALIAQAREVAKEAFNEGAAELISDLNVKSFGWTQYTPYFNDGDECVFSAHVDYPFINGADEYGDTYDDEDDEDDTCKSCGADPTPNAKFCAQCGTEFGATAESQVPAKEKFEAVKDFLRSFDEDDLRHMFGDHVKVTVTADGATAEEYNHD